MVIREYPESYLNEAREALGSMFDFAICEKGLDPDEFAGAFLLSGIADQIASGNPKYISGKSGIELALEAASRSGIPLTAKESVPCTDRSEAYWAGWALAGYQWSSQRSFRTILDRYPLKQFLSFYHPYHEADPRKLESDLETVFEKGETRLRILRKQAGLTQAELAVRSETSLRSIQMWEQRRNDIRKAQGLTLRNLAVALRCQIEDLIG